MKPYMHKSQSLKPMLAIESRVDKCGNIFFSVEYQDNKGLFHNIAFEHMTSAIDFIKSNF